MRRYFRDEFDKFCQSQSAEKSYASLLKSFYDEHEAFSAVVKDKIDVFYLASFINCSSLISDKDAMSEFKDLDSSLSVRRARLVTDVLRKTTKGKMERMVSIDSISKLFLIFSKQTAHERPFMTEESKIAHENLFKVCSSVVHNE